MAQASLLTGCARSMRLSAACSGVSATTRCTKTPGRWTFSRVELAGLDESLDLGDRDAPGRRRERVEVAGALVETRLPCRSPTQARTSAKSVTMPLLEDVVRAPSTRTRGSPSAGERARPCRRRRTATAARPRRPGCRPRRGCRTRGSRPRRRAAARRACPAGSARPRARRWRNCRSNSLFSPTYDDVIRGIRLARSSTPRPQSSTPQLLDTTRGRSAGLEQRLDQHGRDAAEPEPADRERRAVADVGDGLGGAGPTTLVPHRCLFLRAARGWWRWPCRRPRTWSAGRSGSRCAACGAPAWS